MTTIQSSFIGGGTPFWKPRKQNVLKYKCSRATVSAYIAANPHCTAKQISIDTGGRIESVGAVLLSLLELKVVKRSEDSRGVFLYTAVTTIEPTATAQIRAYLAHGEFVRSRTIIEDLNLKGGHQKLKRMANIKQLEGWYMPVPEFQNRKVKFYRLSQHLLQKDQTK